MTGIYMIKNKINGKIYIGQAKNIEKRWTRHKMALRNNKHQNQLLQRAWNKYGVNNFEFIVIEICKLEDANEKEKFYIIKYDSYNTGYNLTIGGDGSYGFKHSEETKKKMSESGKVKKITDEHKESLKRAAKNRPPVSNETKEKLRKSKLGKKRGQLSDEWRQNISKAIKEKGPWNKGKKLPREMIEKAIQKKKKFNEQQENEIKQLLQQNISTYKIAAMYGVAQSTIFKIKKSMRG